MSRNGKEKKKINAKPTQFFFNEIGFISYLTIVIAALGDLLMIETVL